MGTAHKSKSTRVRHGRSDRTSPKLRRKPAPPQPSKLPAKPRLSPEAAPARESVPITALREIHQHLRPILSAVVVVEHALLQQNAELDDDAARVLRVHVGDPLCGQTDALGRLLGEVDDEDDGGAV